MKRPLFVGGRTTSIQRRSPIQICEATVPRSGRDGEGVSPLIDRSNRGAFEQHPRAATGLPAVGEDFLGFRLLDELGRGAFGKVYLARQGNLADRPVVLKITPRLNDEPGVLAQLQHTNIVPVYSIHRLERLQAICMPYFGSTTLKDIYENLESQATLPEFGFGLISTLYVRKAARNSRQVERSDHQVREQPCDPSMTLGAEEAGLPEAKPAAETLKYLEGLTYVQAVLWVVSRLASGLAHAHERAILHLDLKPGNILLTDEGQPMLLDFNLSMDLKAESSRTATVGGTLFYMSPEQIEAFRGDDRRLDGRSDVYALGIILFELLTGRRPFPIPEGPRVDIANALLESRTKQPPPVRCWNKAVSPAIESIVRHCLEPNPALRYRSAAEVQVDIERHLSHCALRYAREPSLRERAAKCMRRHPTISSTTSIGMLAFASLAVLCSASWLAIRDSHVATARLQYIDFHRKFERCQLLLNTTRNASRDSLRNGTRLAQRALGVYLDKEPENWKSTSQVRYLRRSERIALQSELTELIILDVRARVALAERGGPKAEHRETYRWGIDRLEWVRLIDPQPPAAFHHDRARLFAALGHDQAAAQEQALASANPLRSVQDEYLLGTSLLAAGHPDRAEVSLSRAAARDSRSHWAWFALGICHSDQGRHADAAFDFGACSILAPHFAWPHLNRGLALARCGRLTEALASYDRALELDHRFVEAWVDRGLAHLELGHSEQARRDLACAIEQNEATPAVLAAHAEAIARLGHHDLAERAFAANIHSHPNDPLPLVARGFARLGRDQAGALADFSRALTLDPRNARAHLGQAYLVRAQDPRAALEHVERALTAEPDFGDALQLRALIRARGNDPRAESDVDRFLRVTTPQRLYNAACTLSLLSRANSDARLTTRALDYLERALDAGLPPEQTVQDRDLDSLRKSPRFEHLIAAAHQKTMGQVSERGGHGDPPR
jgi:eukaryotic-like serine/threonine-protein kinase